MRRIATLQTATILLLIAALGACAWQIREGRQAHQALCVLKADLAGRIKAGHEFLEQHPKGIAGIPAATIQTSITNQEATYKALRVLSCPKPEGAP